MFRKQLKQIQKKIKEAKKHGINRCAIVAETLEPSSINFLQTENISFEETIHWTTVKRGIFGKSVRGKFKGYILSW